jgi:tetratricopeptide (TPR) repeat protein
VAAVAFSDGDSDEAEKLYRHLLEVSPNWVTAYNQLGYITMRQGRFPEAEEYFTSYRFIAPDQANPHDSLAELYTIQGRYEDAETSLENALLIKPNFWPSYMHLVQTHIMMRDFDGAREVLDRWSSIEGAAKRELDNLGCVVELGELEFDRSWAEILENLQSPCLEKASPLSYMTYAAHRAACHLGDWELAGNLESRVKDQLDKAKEKGSEKSIEVAGPMLIHMEGVRLALQGDVEGAEIKFRDADASMQYWELAPGMFKLSNRLLLVETLFAQGRDVEAHKLLAKVRSVNPALAAEFEEDGLKILGLDRG